MGIKLVTAKDLAHSVHKHISSRRPISYCTTCYQRIDRVTGGIRPGDAWVLRADTSWGKSTYGGVAVPDENVDRGKRVLVVSNEDPPEMYGRRIACRRARVPYTALRDRKLDRFEAARVEKEIIGLEQSGNLWMVHAVGKSIERICGLVRSAIRIHRLNLVVLDYAQKLWAEAKTQNRERELYYCAERFADTCKEDNAASLLLSQMTINDRGENRTKGAGAIKDAAETLLEGRSDNRAGVISKTIRCVKIKEGRAGGEFEVEWDDDSASFVADVPRELGLPDNDEE
jgi:replicative DNA helicase